MINPEPSRPDHDYCSIGFCEKEQKWYGWSHRAMYGFGIGSGVKKGDIGYNASNEEEWIENQVNFWSDADKLFIHHYIEENNKHERLLIIEWTWSDSVPNVKIRGTKDTYEQVIPSVFGRGEWTAETLDDAKQMAIDFADNIA